MLSLQILWSEKCDGALAKVASSGSAPDMSPVQGVLDSVQNMLNVLADSVLHEQPPVRRKKLEHLVRDGAEHLIIAINRNLLFTTNICENPTPTVIRWRL